MTCTAARKSADWATKATATPKSVMMRHSAECTGLREASTPTAPTRISTAAVAKTSTPAPEYVTAITRTASFAAGPGDHVVVRPRPPDRAGPAGRPRVPGG